MAGGTPGNFASRIIKTPPDNGSFPIDRDNACKDVMVKVLKCLSVNSFENEGCQEYSKEYLKCRMDNNLMAHDDWKSLGFKDTNNDKPS